MPDTNASIGSAGSAPFHDATRREAFDVDRTLETLTSSALDPVFYTPSLLGQPSAWWTHVPFAFWIMTACRPRLFVELGSHYGVSYSAFCEANLIGQLGAQCIAVDTWEGDEHAGFYGDAVFNDLRSFNDQRYGAFSTLIRSKFHEALDLIQDGSVDLLHIDGRHRYEDVREDFESWLPKLSDRAVVLFHDTNVREGDFGVHRAFAELRSSYPAFEFLHGSGLGVAILGTSPPPAIAKLCATNDPKQVALIRSRFSHIGSLWFVTAREKLGSQDHARQIAAYEQEQRVIRNVRSRAVRRLVSLRGNVEDLNQRLAAVSERAAADRVRYKAAFDDPAISVRSRVIKQIATILGPFGHRLRSRIKDSEVIRRSEFFDRSWYIATYPDVASSRIHPAQHYLLYGSREGREPGPYFSGADYLTANPDIAIAGMNPLLHYELYGRAEGRRGGVPRLHSSPSPDSFPSATVQSYRSGKRRSILWVSYETETPGHSYRVTRYIRAAEDNDVAADWVDVRDVSKAVAAARRCDILILWRVPWSAEVKQIITAARRAGAHVLFDVDDLMIDPELAKPEIIDGIRSQHLASEGVKGHYASVRRTMLEADQCYTTSEELAFHMRWAGKPTFVLPNGFDQSTHDVSLRAATKWRSERDGLIRIGYAGGSRTHQKDLALAIPGIVAALKYNPKCRLVLFRTPDGKLPLIDVEEFPALEEVAGQIEWRPLQVLKDLPWELARFDINLAPLEYGNAFCEAKSELKFFEAALVGVPTVASPTGPFRRAIKHGENGFLAASAEDWRHCLCALIDNSDLRENLAHNAYLSSLSAFGPRRRALQFGVVLDQIEGGARAARGFALAAARAASPRPLPTIYPSEIVFESDKGEIADVTVIIPSYNYENYIGEALDSVLHQSLKLLDLVVVDGGSQDNSLIIAERWAHRNARRFNRIVVLKNRQNYGLGPCRNSGFDVARSAYVLPLDADNRLRPDCCESLLKAIKGSAKAYVYPTIQHFGASQALLSNAPYSAQRFVAGNYIDAMALVSKEAWAMAGGYDHVRFGWEDFDLWCKFAELGLVGEWVQAELADYRVHEASMMKKQTTVSGNFLSLMRDFEARHPWVSLIDRQLALLPVKASTPAKPLRQRVDDLLPILRCPITRQKLTYSEDGDFLISLDRTQKWPIVQGRPALAPELAKPDVRPEELISNEIPEAALNIINDTKGWVLNLSAGGSLNKYDHVVEVEYAIFRHTDVLADAQSLPFDDESFDAIISMNAFEHYRDPTRVASELLRILKPGGKIHIRTAFLQPLHEKPWHFYNCTRYGMKAWFEAFNQEKLDVSANFSPNHTVAWIASECEQSFRQDLSNADADAFVEASIGDFVNLWRNPDLRASPLWTNFEKLKQDHQEITAAGFEFIGRKPTRADTGHRHLQG